MNNALLYLGGLLVVTLAALFAVPHFIDWNGYRGVFEEEATKVLGRDVRVGGGVNVRFLPTPYVKFEKVRIADPTGQTGEPFVRVESFTMRLSGPALLRGVLEANEIELHKPVLTLALDNHGGGNWGSVHIKSGALPFVPTDVSLHSVRFIDGVVALFNSDAQSVWRADAINGEFSAEALRGPFKFKGQAQWGGEDREFRFATTALNGEGSLQIKSTMRALKSDASFALDGRIEDLAQKPRFTGAMTGKIPIRAAASPASPAAAKSVATTASDAAVIELKSRIEATMAGAKIEDIALSVENSAEPQLLSGSAAATFGTDARLDLNLVSKWLDVDRLAGADQDGATFLKIKSLGLSLLRGLAGNGTARARIDVDQVKLGGETAGGLSIDAERRGSAVHLTHMRAGLPGGSRLNLSGDLKDDAGAVSFVGFGSVHGSNVARLLEWAAKSGADLDVTAEGPFAADGRVQVTDTRFELTEASVAIGGRPFSGDVVVSGEGRRRVAVTLEAARLDSRELFPDTSRALEDKLRQAFGFPAIARGPQEAAPVAATANDASDISVRVLAGELKHGDHTFRDVDATVGLEGGNIRIPSARFTTARGLTVNVDARFDRGSDRVKGTLGYDLSAPSIEALRDFADITGFSALVPVERIVQSGAARLAGLVKLGARAPASADVTADGTVQLARISANAQFDGGLQGWRGEASRLHLTARSNALGSLLSAFGFDPAAVPTPGAHEAELVFASNGVLSTGAAAVLEVTAPDFDVAYNGRLAWPGDTATVVAGVVAIKASDVRDVMALLGASAARGLAGVPIDGKFEVKRDSAGWTLAMRQLKAGTSQLGGAINIAPKTEGPSEISGYVRADKITLAGLLAPLLDKPTDTLEKAQPDKLSIWPDAVFNFDPLNALKGELRVRYGTLQVHHNVTARDGMIKLQVGPGTVEARELSGQAAGGAMSGSIKLAKESGGVTLDGALKISGADLSKIGAAASGKASFDVSGKAQALSPAALLAVLSGAGSITLDGAKLPAPTARVVDSIVADVLAEKLDNAPDDLADALEVRTASAVADIGSRTIPFKIADGIAKLDTIAIDSGEGATTVSTMLDLMSLSLDSAWKLAAVVPPLPKPDEDIPGWSPAPAKGRLPPASVVFTGALSNLAALNIAVDAADMQRELAVRQMERNVEDLERLRKLDEYRASQEQERRRALDAERAAAAAAAAAAKAAPTDASSGVNPQAPPVLPQSAGTQGAGPPAGDASAPSPQPSAASSEARPTQITVEPITPAGEKPAAQPTPAARPQAARTPTARPPSERRTTSDEVIRSLGGVP